MNVPGQHLLVKEWIKSPETFAREALCWEKMSDQQKRGFRALGTLVNAKRKRDLGIPLEPGESKVVDKIGVSIMSGKGCHAAGTMIMLADGRSVPVESVNVGDRLMGDDSTPRRVLRLIRGHGQMHRITYRDGTNYVVNDDHILCLRHDNRPNQVLEMSVREFLAIRGKRSKYRAIRVPVEYPQAKVPVRLDPYILGLWLGDGSKQHAVFFNVDPEPIEAIKKFAESRGLNYSVRIVKEHRCFGPRGGSPQNSLLADLHHYDVFKNKHIPDAYLYGSTAVRLELLAGLVDSDGHLDQRGKRRLSIVQKDRRLSLQIQQLARSLGIHCTFRQVSKRWQNGVGTYYELSMTRNVEIVPARIPRKQPRVAHRRPFGLNFSFAIESLGFGDYYGFEIDGNRRYLLSDFTVTHNSGKDVYAAACILWFMYCFPDCLIPCTAPTQRHLRDVLWSQVYKQMKHSQEVHRAAGSPFDIEEVITWQTDKLFWAQDKGRKWYAIARTASPNASEEEQKATIAGLHAHHMLVVADEAASVSDAAFSQLETTLTEPVNVALLIFNPTRTSGFALHSQTKNRARWICLRWNSEESPFVTRESIAERAKYGTNSNIYRVTVLGLPPNADPDTLIPMDWVMDAVDRDMQALDDDPVVIGIDVARGMDDKSIIYVLQGPETLEILEYRGMDTEQLSGWAMATMFRYEPAYTMVDVLGMGWGVADKLRHRTPFNVVDLDVHTNAAENHRFYRLRDELWWRLRERFERHAIQIPDDEELIAQLTTPKWAEIAGRIQVDKKREMKKALARAGQGYSSPDKADALCMCMYFDSDQLRQMRKPTTRKRSTVIDTWRTA